MGQPWGIVSPKTVSKIGCINVTSMGVWDDSDREIKVVLSLSNYKLDICGLSEVRWAGSGTKIYPATHNSLNKSDGYSVYFSGNEKG